MMHPYSPSRRWLAVPGIGFPQNISVGPDALDFKGFLGSARAPDSEDFRSAQKAAGHFCGSLFSQSGGIRLPKIAGAVTGRPGPPCPDDAPRE
jgi:hypothetical protein